MRAFAYAGLTALVAGGIFGQSDNAPKFEIADVHVSAKTANTVVRTAAPRNGRYEIKNATMLDLIRTAWGFDADKILEGPNWLELDRFDVIAKIPTGAATDAQKTMLQSLLEDRFKLVVRKETRPLTTWALVSGKQPHLKQADGSGSTGCKLQTGSGPPTEGAGRLFMSNPDGTTTTINLGPGAAIQYECRNMTMAAFAEGLRSMLGVQNLGTNPVLDETGLKGTWNFDVKWSLALIGLANGGEQISATDAVEKQLGLKLESRQIPKPVIVVESVNRTAGANPPGLSEALPAIPAPTEFEVADVKLAAPISPGAPPMMIGLRMMPGGRFVSQNMPMRLLIGRAFNTNNNDQVVGLPSFVDSARFDITAKAPAEAVTGPGVDMDALAPMLRALLVDRFKMTYHSEERPMTAYSLVAAKPKLKKADAASRIFCKTGPAPAGAPPGSQMLTCQNATMAMFAERLQNLAPGLNWPVLDATGIEGGWDFALTFSRLPPNMNGPGRGGDAGLPDAAPLASDPGGGYTIFEAIDKQLGLKLESRKRPMPVIVIDHLEQKPTDN
jgi:uncharacterized protein (TIGR03435 family)